MKRWFLAMTAAVLAAASYAQQIIINPDGTHSVVMGSGGIRTIVNPDGTHSTVIGSGGVKTIVNPNGTHSTLIGSGGVKTLVNPDGTQSTIIDQGSTKIVINPNGTQSTVIDHGSSISVLNPPPVDDPNHSGYASESSSGYTITKSRSPRWAVKRIHRAEKRRDKKN